MDRKKLALIHILKKELQLTEDAYRFILKQAAGVNSAKELDEEKFRKLMNYFVRSTHYRLNRYGLTIKQKLYIKHLAGEAGWDAEHLDNFIHKYYQKASLDRLTRKDAAKAIEALKNIRERMLKPKKDQGLPS